MRTGTDPRERGMSLVELLIALVVLAAGILAVGGLFPAGSREAVKDQTFTKAHFYAQEKIEELRGKAWMDPDLALGRHPVGVENLGSLWHRWYDVSAMPVPLDNLRRIQVSVYWTGLRSDTVTATTYVRR